MAGENKKRLPASSQRIILIFTLLLILLIIGGPFWSYKTTQKLDQQISDLKQDIEEQKLLAEAALQFKLAVKTLEKNIEDNRSLSKAQPPSAKEGHPPLAEEDAGAGVPETVAKAGQMDPASILKIERRGLTLQETADIGAALSAMAENVGLTPDSIRPDVTSLMGDKGEIVVDARVTGSYTGLWSFLHDLGAHPAFKEFLQITMREIPESREMNLKVRFYTEI